MIHVCNMMAIPNHNSSPAHHSNVVFAKWLIPFWFSAIIKRHTLCGGAHYFSCQAGYRLTVSVILVNADWSLKFWSALIPALNNSQQWLSCHCKARSFPLPGNDRELTRFQYLLAITLANERNKPEPIYLLTYCTYKTAPRRPIPFPSAFWSVCNVMRRACGLAESVAGCHPCAICPNKIKRVEMQRISTQICG